MEQFIDEPIIRPVTRGDCRGGIRPCPFVGCRFNLLLDVHPTSGTITLNRVGSTTSLVTNDDTDEAFDEAAEAATDAWAEADDLPSCALDAVDAQLSDETPIADVATILGVSRQRVDQLVSKAVVNVRKRQGLATFAQ